jgi:hypothetical protein
MNPSSPTGAALRLAPIAPFAAAAGLILATVTASPVVAAGGSTLVECGQVSAYAAPDPVAPTPGSLTIGMLAPWAIDPSAALSQPVIDHIGTNGGSPTCVELTLDGGGTITALDFAAHGRIHGSVVYDIASTFYGFADRLVIPADVVDGAPVLGALFSTSADAGTPLRIDFTVDPALGMFIGFDGHAAFCGQGGLDGDGNGSVGEATIPAAVLDAADRAALQGAGTRKTCATVHGVGTVGENGSLDASADVRISVASARHPQVVPTLPPTSTVGAPMAGGTSGSGAVPGILVAACVALAAIAVRGRTARRPGAVPRSPDR